MQFVYILYAVGKNWLPCTKYIAINELTAYIFHYGNKTCVDRQRNKRQNELDSDAITINQRIKPS